MQSTLLMRKTKAHRVLLPESDILTIKYRMDLGVTLTAAVKIISPRLSVVSAIKLVRYHTEMEEALAREDFVLFDDIRNSLFPPWVAEQKQQPATARYNGYFPYGYWSEDAA